MSLPDEHKVDIFIDSIYFTSYIYPDNMEKPVLYPLNSSSVIPVTRGFPIDPKPNERIDHPHQTGMWLNYGNVNGLDFWNNSYNIPEEEKDHYGSIRHKEITKIKSGNDHGELDVTMDWLKPEKLSYSNTGLLFNPGISCPVKKWNRNSKSSQKNNSFVKQKVIQNIFLFLYLFVIAVTNESGIGLRIIQAIPGYALSYIAEIYTHVST